MKIELFSASELPRKHFLLWAELQQANSELCSPFFRPEFAESVSKVRNDAFTASIDDGRAFFSFQKNMFGFARPIGGAVSDYHGVISEPGYRYDPAQLLSACGLRSYDFDHVPASQTEFSAYAKSEAKSYILDIGEVAVIAGKEHSRYMTKRRKLEREFGSVEIEFDSQDPHVLELCLEWKSAQYKRTGGNDLFARPWAPALVRSIGSRKQTEFAGVISVLRAGGRPIAAHFGMRSNNILHYWFPSYDISFSRYSPGMLLLLSMISEAPKLGITTIDFGKGYADYKEQLSNRLIPLLEGSAAVSLQLQAIRSIPTDTLNWVRQLPLLKLIPKRARHFLRRVERSRRFS